MDPEIRHLRAICVIADAGSVTRAATRLGISQPALTALLQRVERSIGGRLFERSRNGVRPTALGEHALARARLVLAEIDSFVGDIARSAHPLAALRMGSAHMECVGTIVDRLHTALPHAEITVRVEASAITLTQSLAHHRLDFAIVGMMDDNHVPLAPELAQRTLLARLPIFVALAAAHPLAAQDEIDLADLANENWINPPGADDGSLASLKSACRQAGFNPKIRYEAPSGGGRQLIATANAVQLVEPTSTDSAGVAIRRLAGEPLSARLVLAWWRNRLTDNEAEAAYLAVAGAYTTHATQSPAYHPWWESHPEVHPRTE